MCVFKKSNAGPFVPLSAHRTRIENIVSDVINNKNTMADKGTTVRLTRSLKEKDTSALDGWGLVKKTPVTVRNSCAGQPAVNLVGHILHLPRSVPPNPTEKFCPTAFPASLGRCVLQNFQLAWSGVSYRISS